MAAFLRRTVRLGMAALLCAFAAPAPAVPQPGSVYQIQSYDLNTGEQGQDLFSFGEEARFSASSSSSGQAEVNGDDLIVSLGCSTSVRNISNTIMHELGHNLGLRHGGFENCNYKPNYNSVMNYRYQFPGVDSNCTPPGDGVLDYSAGSRITLDERALDESEGICGPGNPWDWNGNRLIETLVQEDVNASDSACFGTFTVLADHDDWGNLRFTGIDDFDGASVQSVEIIDCHNLPPPD
jgi:hypothetical protein